MKHTSFVIRFFWLFKLVNIYIYIFFVEWIASQTNYSSFIILYPHHYIKIYKLSYINPKLSSSHKPNNNYFEPSQGVDSRLFSIVLNAHFCSNICWVSHICKSAENNLCISIFLEPWTQPFSLFECNILTKQWPDHNVEFKYKYHSIASIYSSFFVQFHLYYSCSF